MQLCCTVQFGLIQTLTATIVDVVPSLNKGHRPLMLLIATCVGFFLLGLLMTTPVSVVTSLCARLFVSINNAFS